MPLPELFRIKFEPTRTTCAKTLPIDVMAAPDMFMFTTPTTVPPVSGKHACAVVIKAFRLDPIFADSGKVVDVLVKLFTTELCTIIPLPFNVAELANNVSVE